MRSVKPSLPSAGRPSNHHATLARMAVIARRQAASGRRNGQALVLACAGLVQRHAKTEVRSVS